MDEELKLFRFWQRTTNRTIGYLPGKDCADAYDKFFAKYKTIYGETLNGLNFSYEEVNERLIDCKLTVESLEQKVSS